MHRRYAIDVNRRKKEMWYNETLVTTPFMHSNLAESSGLEEMPDEGEGNVKFLKRHSAGETSEAPNVRVFKPSKEAAENPEAMVQEFRQFIASDLQEGEVVQISHEHARKMLPTAAPAGAAGKKGYEIEEFKMTEYDRSKIGSILLKELALEAALLVYEL